MSNQDDDEFDRDKTPILTPCHACRGERQKRKDDGRYWFISCRWCNGKGAMHQNELVKWLKHSKLLVEPLIDLQNVSGSI